MTATLSTHYENELAELLNDLSDVQAEMLDLLAAKRQCMVQADLEGMNRLQQREQELGQRLLQCHQRRTELLRRSEKEGLPGDSLGNLAASLEGGRQGSLGRKTKMASAKMRLLQHQSLTNWVLAQRTLLHLSQMLNIIATGGRLQPTYGNKESPQSRGSLLDHEA